MAIVTGQPLPALLDCPPWAVRALKVAQNQLVNEQNVRQQLARHAH